MANIKSLEEFNEAIKLLSEKFNESFLVNSNPFLEKMQQKRIEDEQERIKNQIKETMNTTYGSGIRYSPGVGVTQSIGLGSSNNNIIIRKTQCITDCQDNVNGFCGINDLIINEKGMCTYFGARMQESITITEADKIAEEIKEELREPVRRRRREL